MERGEGHGDARLEIDATALALGVGRKDGWNTGISWSVNLCRVQFLMCTFRSSSSLTRLNLDISPRTANTKHSVSNLPFTSAAWWRERATAATSSIRGGENKVLAY